MENYPIYSDNIFDANFVVKYFLIDCTLKKRLYKKIKRKFGLENELKIQSYKSSVEGLGTLKTKQVFHWPYHLIIFLS